MRCVIPFYDYKCRACGEYIEDILISIANRDVPLSEPCPVCDATDCIERVPCAPNIGDAMRLGRTHLPSSWTDKLAQIKQKHHRSTMHVPTPGKREI